MKEPSSAALIDALAVPAMIAARDGTVHYANAEMAALLDNAPVGLEAFTDVITRSLGQRAPTFGSLRLGDGSGPALRVTASRVAGDPPYVLVQIAKDNGQHFRALNVKVEELGREVAERRHAEAALAKTLVQRDLLFDELQHRVKNNIQMLSGMLQAQLREVENDEARAVLIDALGRIGAVGAVQRLLYRQRDEKDVAMDRLLDLVAKGCAATSAQSIDLGVQAAAIKLPAESAVPIALIANELLTNAIRHGNPDAGSIDLDFGPTDAGLQLTVRDSGDGLDPSRSDRRASGLGLVRGLLAQLGGRLEIHQQSGTICRCDLRHPGEAA